MVAFAKDPVNSYRLLLHREVLVALKEPSMNPVKMLMEYVT